MTGMAMDTVLARYRWAPGFWKKAKSALCSGILLFTLAIIGLLAVPTCLFITVMGAVWNLGDKILSRLSR